jgi:hypothetical protein
MLAEHKNTGGQSVIVAETEPDARDGGGSFCLLLVCEGGSELVM